MEPKASPLVKLGTRRVLVPLITVAKLGAVAVGAILQAIHGSWAWSIGMALLWFAVWFEVAVYIGFHLEKPIEPWRLLAQRFARRKKVTLENAECVGKGTFEGDEANFALRADKEALSLRICDEPFLRPNTVTVPWDQIDLGPVGFNENGDYVASLSVRSLPGCNFVLPWRRRFPSRVEGGKPRGWGDGPSVSVPTTKSKSAM